MIVYRLTLCSMKGLERGKVADNQTRQTCHVDCYTTVPQRGEEGWLICTICQMQRVDNSWVAGDVTKNQTKKLS